MRPTLTAVSLLVASVAYARPVLVDDVNGQIPGLDHARYIWAVSDIGWIYTPALDYDLTHFGSSFLYVGAAHRVITTEIYDGPPAAGGTLLRSLSVDTAPFLRFPWGRFDTPLPMISGQPYFVGIRNVAGLGVNVTDGDPRAESLGAFYSSFPDEAPYSFVETVDEPDIRLTAPFLFFFADDGTAEPIPTVPEPALLGLMTAAALACRLHRR